MRQSIFSFLARFCDRCTRPCSIAHYYLDHCRLGRLSKLMVAAIAALENTADRLSWWGRELVE
jgi:hypothetical protein